MHLHTRKTVWQKAAFLLGIVLLIATVFLSANFWLQRRCTQLLQEKILPDLARRFNATLAVKSISINPLTGTLLLKEATLRDPADSAGRAICYFPRLRIRIGLLELLQERAISIKSMRSEDAHILILRDRNGVLNITHLVKIAASSHTPATSPASTPETASTDSHNLARLSLQKARLKAKITYRDYRFNFGGKPLELVFDCEIQAANLANYGTHEKLTGTFIVKGLINAGEAGVPFELRGKLAPLVDLQKPTFEIVGAAKALDFEKIPALAQTLKIRQGQVIAALAATANAGAFISDKSHINLTFNQVRLDSSTEAALGGLRLPETFTLDAAISGTWLAPQIDLTPAISRLLLNKGIIETIVQEIRQSARL